MNFYNLFRYRHNLKPTVEILRNLRKTMVSSFTYLHSNVRNPNLSIHERSTLCTYSHFQALSLLSHPFISITHPEMESQIKKHFLFCVELLTRLVSINIRSFRQLK